MKGSERQRETERRAAVIHLCVEVDGHKMRTFENELSMWGVINTEVHANEFLFNKKGNE